jgi:peptide/nickel transport system ATP-binding protein
MSLLDIKDLTIHFMTEGGEVKAVNGISLHMEAGKTLGLVGETGAGKTTTALGILRLVPEPGKILDGTITYKGQDIMQMSDKEVQDLRGNEISMIFQDPMTALNPVMTVGDQVAEVILRHQDCTKVQAQEQMIDILGKVGIGPERAGDYPHQFSGGMKQRVIIAIALACNPQLLIADEPTTALDVTIQAQVLRMINDLKKELGTAMLLITHDLGIVAESCDDVAIMYAGTVIEYGSVEDVFDHTAHPYTKGLFGSLPRLDVDVDFLSPIPGLMPDPVNLPEGCPFHPRCKHATRECTMSMPPVRELTPGHQVRCHHVEGISSPTSVGSAAAPEAIFGEDYVPTLAKPVDKEDE